MKRRDLLKFIAAAPVATAPICLYAAPATQARLLVVFMRGGYDASSVLVPVTSSFYYEARPNIAVPPPAAATNAAIPIGADWGLHPALRNSLLPLYQKGQLAFIPFAGTEDVSRSHFATQDTIELGQAHDRARDFRSGFLNRLTGVLSVGSRPIAFTDRLPVVYRGEAQVPNMALKQIRKPVIEPREAAVISEMYSNTPLAAPVSEGFSLRDGILQEMATEMEAANRNAITPRGFELEARRIARLMRDKFNVGFVDVGGWDTHVNQGSAEGYLANRLEQFGRGLSGFADEMASTWPSTVVVVISEFGRTFRENGNRGTDHGHGSVYWALGGSVRGGRVVGEQVAVNPDTLHQNRDYPVLNEYRAMFGGLFSRMYGLNGSQVERVFPGTKPKDVGLV